MGAVNHLRLMPIELKLLKKLVYFYFYILFELGQKLARDSLWEFGAHRAQLPQRSASARFQIPE